MVKLRMGRMHKMAWCDTLVSLSPYPRIYDCRQVFKFQGFSFLFCKLRGLDSKLNKGLPALGIGLSLIIWVFRTIGCLLDHLHWSMGKMNGQMFLNMNFQFGIKY